MGDLLNLVNLCGRNLNCSLVRCCPCLFFLAKNTDVKLLGILCNLRLVICYLIPLSPELFITIYLNYMLLCLKKEQSENRDAFINRITLIHNKLLKVPSKGLTSLKIPFLLMIACVLVILLCILSDRNL